MESVTNPSPLHEPVVLSTCNHEIEAFVLEVLQVLEQQTCPFDGCETPFGDQKISANLINLPNHVLEQGLTYLADPFHRKIFTDIHRLACGHFLDGLSIEHRGDDKSCPLCKRISINSIKETHIQARINYFVRERLKYSIEENARKAKEFLAAKNFQKAFAVFQAQTAARDQQLNLQRTRRELIAHHQNIRLFILSLVVIWVSYYFFF